MSRALDRSSRRRRGTRRTLTGRDLAHVRTAPRRRRRLPAALLLAALVAGLSLAALRVDILRLRYALADALEQEQDLLERRSVATARLEGLRDPARLASLAKKRGLSRPSRVIELLPTRLAAGPRP